MYDVLAKEAPMKRNQALIRSSISIRPYFIPEENMGLEKYGLVLFDGTMQKDMVSVHTNGLIHTYRTGLNPFAPDVEKLDDGTVEGREKYEAKIKSIMKTVAILENKLNSNFKVSPDKIDVNNPETFWNNVTMFRSVVSDKMGESGKPIHTPNYWDNILLTLDNNGKVLNADDPSDIALLSVTEAGGFALVAPSLEIAQQTGKYKFYLDKREDTAVLRADPMKLRNKAGAELQKLYDKDTNKLFYVTKLLSSDSMFYKTGKNSTPNDILYEDCGKYIEGMVSDKKPVACQKFLDACKMSMEELKLNCIVKDAAALRLINYKSDGHIYHLSSGTLMGKNVADVVEFLKSALNENIYKSLHEQMVKEWAG